MPMWLPLPWAAQPRKAGAAVLSIGKLTVEQSRYYERQVAQGRDDYYSGRGESPGRWTGSEAETTGSAAGLTTTASWR
jgi:hypothetical protein